MIRGIHHVAISTPDIEATVKFYEEAFGFEKIIDSGWPKGVDVIDTIVGLKGSSCTQAIIKAGNTYLELFEYHTPEPKTQDGKRPANDHGYTHFCVDVVDIEYEYERLQSLGMTFNCPPGPPGEFGGGFIRATYGRDPFGNIIEIQEIISKDHKMFLKVE